MIPPEPADAPSLASSRRRRGVAAVRQRLAVGRAFLADVLDRRSRANRWLTVGLGALVGGACLWGLPAQLDAFPAGNDIELPLRAASHWVNGGQAYPAAAMLVTRGPDLPFLYPPFLLPFLAPIAGLPRDVVTVVWLAMCAVCAAWTCRRLAIPWAAIPFVLAWPPFAEGLIVGNVQIICFAAFAALLYERVDGAVRSRSFLPSGDAANGLLAAAIGVFKVSQVLPGLYLARRRLRAAVLGAAVVLVGAAATLPLTGLSIYFDWLAQLQRAADPAWDVGGVALGRLFGIPELLLTAIGVAMALTIRGRDGAAWLGIALILAAPNAHGYTFLFLVPGLLTLRRDLAIVLAALFLGVYHGYAWWLATLFVAYFLVASARWTWLRAVDFAPDPQEAGGRDASLGGVSAP